MALPGHPEVCSPGKLLRNHPHRERNPGVTQNPATPSSGRTLGCRATDAIPWPRRGSQAPLAITGPVLGLRHPSFLHALHAPSLLSVPYAARIPCPPPRGPGHRRRPRTCQPSPESPSPAGTAHTSRPPSSQAARTNLRSAGLDLHLTGLSGARGRPAQRERPLRARSHAHHPGLRSLTHVSPRPLKERHRWARAEAARRGPATFKRRD